MSSGKCPIGPALLGAPERVLLCIVTGIALGHWLSAPFQQLGQMEVAQVNLPVLLSVVKIVNNIKGWYEAGLLTRGE